MNDEYILWYQQKPLFPSGLYFWNDFTVLYWDKRPNQNLSETLGFYQDNISLTNGKGQQSSTVMKNRDKGWGDGAREGWAGQKSLPHVEKAG